MLTLFVCGLSNHEGKQGVQIDRKTINKLLSFKMENLLDFTLNILRRSIEDLCIIALPAKPETSKHPKDNNASCVCLTDALPILF